MASSSGIDPDEVGVGGGGGAPRDDGGDPPRVPVRVHASEAPEPRAQGARRARDGDHAHPGSGSSRDCARWSARSGSRAKKPDSPRRCPERWRCRWARWPRAAARRPCAVGNTPAEASYLQTKYK